LRLLARLWPFPYKRSVQAAWYIHLVIFYRRVLGALQRDDS